MALMVAFTLKRGGKSCAYMNMASPLSQVHLGSLTFCGRSIIAHFPGPLLPSLRAICSAEGSRICSCTLVHLKGQQLAHPFLSICIHRSIHLTISLFSIPFVTLCSTPNLFLVLALCSGVRVALYNLSVLIDSSQHKHRWLLN